MSYNIYEIFNVLNFDQFISTLEKPISWNLIEKGLKDHFQKIEYDCKNVEFKSLFLENRKSYKEKYFKKLNQKIESQYFWNIIQLYKIQNNQNKIDENFDFLISEDLFDLVIENNLVYIKLTTFAKEIIYKNSNNIQKII